MSKDLPLWNNDETDVKLEHRLKSGHVLLEANDIDIVLKKIRGVFSLDKPLLVSDKIRNDLLPSHNGITVLNNANNWHFIMASFKSNIAVFAPHMLFFNSSKWINLSRRLKVRMAYILRIELDFFSYRIFIAGKHICNISKESSEISQMKMSPMEFYINGKLFYKIDEEEDKLTDELIEFISSDVIITIDDKKDVRFVTPLSENEFHTPDEVRHVIFKRRSQKEKNNSNICETPNPITIITEKVGGLFFK